VTATRLPGATRGSSVTFTFDGRQYEGVEGEPLAVSLLAAGRPILSRSFRFHRARGLMCSTGQCGWCECEVDGRPSVRSCRVPVREGLVARGEHALPNVDRDLMSLVGLASRWIPPTFYHHRFLRPRAMRKRYLDVLRWFGGRGRLRVEDRAPIVGRATRRVDTDVLVVGGGRAGLLAALGAAERGDRVLLIEAEPEIGSGWRVEAGLDHDAGTIAELARRAEVAGVEILTGVAAVGWYEGMIAAIGEDTHYEIRARSVVAATGSYERVPLVPGADRSGVLAARTVIALVDRFGLLPGSRALLVGEGEELASVADRLGLSVVIGRVPTASLVSIRGRRHVTGAITRLDGRTERHAVDLVVFGDRSPNLDLVLVAGAAVERRGDTLIPILEADGRSTVPSLRVVGSAAGREIAEGHRHGGTTARGAMVCFCEDVRVGEVRAEQAAGYTDPELIKRRTGALTGPCQGKYCLQSFACLVGTGSDGAGASLPTARPPLRPVRLADLIANDETPETSMPAAARGDA
jgi:sarcosine oxidase, subunit alpha